MYQCAFSRPAERRRLVLFALGYLVLWLLTWYAARVLNTLGVASLWFLPGGLRFCCLLFLGATGLALELGNGLVQLLIQSLFGIWPAAQAPLAGQIAWALSAGAGTLKLAGQELIHKDQWAGVLFSWFTGDFIGVVTLSPLLVVVVWPAIRQFLRHGNGSLSQPSQPLPVVSGVGAKTTLIVAISVAVVMLSPGLLGLAQQSPLVALLLLLPLVGVALRYKLRAAVVAIFLLDSGVVALVALLQQLDLAMLCQMVMLAIALVGLWLGGAVQAHDNLLARLHDFSSLSNDLLWESTPMGLLSMSGRLAGQLVARADTGWRGLIEEHGQTDLTALQRAVQNRSPFSRLQIALKTPAHTPLWVSVNGRPLWDELGESAGYRGTATDINDAVRIKALMAAP
jgi:hypothetical protein